MGEGKKYSLHIVADIMTQMQIARIELIRNPTKQNMLLAQCLEQGKEAMKEIFRKATLLEELPTQRKA